MSGQILREAAALMRTRAEACLASDDQWYEPAEMLEMLRSKDSDSNAQPYDSAHIAGWHPAVALAVADLLEGSADAWDLSLSEREDTETGLAEAYSFEVAVARAYLGDPS